MTLLIVDGYNILFAWEDLYVLAQQDLAGAREELWHRLMNYCGFAGYELLLVFDAHLSAAQSLAKTHNRNKSKGERYQLVFTGKHETADNYIERFCRQNQNQNRNMIVATSDRLIQVLVFSARTMRISARELEQQVQECQEKIRRKINQRQGKGGGNIEDRIHDTAYKKLDKWRKGKK